MSAATAVRPSPALGALAIDPIHRRASIAGAELYLSEAEFELLSALADEPGRLFTHDELLERFSGTTRVSAATIERWGCRLARKLALRGMEGRLRYEPGLGLALEAAGEDVAKLGGGR